MHAVFLEPFAQSSKQAENNIDHEVVKKRTIFEAPIWHRLERYGRLATCLFQICDR